MGPKRREGRCKAGSNMQCSVQGWVTGGRTFSSAPSHFSTPLAERGLCCCGSEGSFPHAAGAAPQRPGPGPPRGSCSHRRQGRQHAECTRKLLFMWSRV